MKKKVRDVWSVVEEQRKDSTKSIKELGEQIVKVFLKLKMYLSEIRVTLINGKIL